VLEIRKLLQFREVSGLKRHHLVPERYSCPASGFHQHRKTGCTSETASIRCFLDVTDIKGRQRLKPRVFGAALQNTGAAGSGFYLGLEPDWCWVRASIVESFMECKLHFSKLVSLLQPESSARAAASGTPSFVCRSLTKQQSKYLPNYTVEFCTDQNPQQQNYFNTAMRAQENKINLRYVERCCRICVLPCRPRQQSSSLVCSEGYQGLKVQSRPISSQGCEASAVVT